MATSMFAESSSSTWALGIGDSPGSKRPLFVSAGLVEFSSRKTKPLIVGHVVASSAIGSSASTPGRRPRRRRRRGGVRRLSSPTRLVRSARPAPAIQPRLIMALASLSFRIASSSKSMTPGRSSPRTSDESSRVVESVGQALFCGHPPAVSTRQPPPAKTQSQERQGRRLGDGIGVGDHHVGEGRRQRGPRRIARGVGDRVPGRRHHAQRDRPRARNFAKSADPGVIFVTRGDPWSTSCNGLSLSGTT